MKDGFATFSEIAKKLRLGAAVGMGTRIYLEPDAALEMAEILEDHENQIRQNLLDAVAAFDEILDEMT